ncbi:dihydropyrimidinase [Lepeophtheirus salmonis]|uniref:dihydropyrimidinase n=1 Tax=Lepeophtheirus salmonis TaxID=72036 RepID=UPI001AEA9254|nr:dihydropyrimidinase-like [Lepeophtheirus salmonis]XP_040575035.1 dihydropyrimidinase-like [Lepeophtheirus salmonis]
MDEEPHVKKVPRHLQSSQNRLIIKGGDVVNEDGIFRADVYIEDRLITKVGQNLDIPGGTKVIDATGRLVMPGGIDTHTHFEMPFMGTKSIDDFYTGTKAALAGGTTMVIDFVIPAKGESLIEAYNKWRTKADGRVCCDYSLHMAVTHWNEDVRHEMSKICSDTFGINSFKMFMAYKDIFMLTNDEMLECMKTCRAVGGLAQVHAENGEAIAENQQRILAKGITGPEGHPLSRPEDIETEAVFRACTLANQVKCPLYVVHVMGKPAAETIIRHRNRGAVVFGEPIAASLACDGQHYYHSCWRHAAGYVLSPPLREDPSTPAFLMDLLTRGELDCTGTDHCTFNSKQKAMGLHDFTKIPNGVNGVEERMSIIWENGVYGGNMSPERFVAVTSTTAAKIFNIYPQKGVIAPGSDADIVIWDPNTVKTVSAETHQYNVDFNIFEGMTLHGIPETVICGGKIVNSPEEGLRVCTGSGRFIPNAPYSPYVYNKVQEADERRNSEEVPVQRTKEDMFIDESKCQEKEMIVKRPSIDLGGHPDVEKETGNRPAIDAKPQVRNRNPPGGRSSIMF